MKRLITSSAVRLLVLLFFLHFLALRSFHLSCYIFGTNCTFPTYYRFAEFLPCAISDSIVLPIFSKFGGLKWVGSLISASLQVHTACFSVFTWVERTDAWVAGFVELSSFMGGMPDPRGSSSQRRTNSRLHRSII